jgi:hypothetical protein
VVKTQLSMARDKYHYEFREALEKDGWTITDDPLTVKIGKITVHIDLGAERIIAAEKGNEKIAVEIKTFSNFSFITALYEAVGKYILYRNFLKTTSSERVLYLAIPRAIYEEFFEEPALKEVLSEEQFKIIVYDADIQTITAWITA